MFTLSDMRIARCAQCALLSGRELDSDSSVSLIYDADYFGRGNAHGTLAGYLDYVGAERALRHQVAEDLVRLMLTRHPTAKSLLDVGCAAGFLVDAATEVGLRSEGIDVSTSAVDLARLHSRGDFRVADLDDISESGAKFDIVGLFDVLEHSPDPRQMILSMSRVLNDGGMGFISVPRYGGWLSQLQWDRYYHFGRDHRWYFTAESLAGLIEKSGIALEVEIFPLGDLLLQLKASVGTIEKYVGSRDHILAVVRG